ncbi:hypothetical protein PSECIP111951_02556 [Pseudoalteromonas holothuriae]|uniref:Uncharacterized protein n=1 Tax=Pseudoalteromonas holothuriae TaxID=2963714 RepID=A0ABM9GK45_9GAMM|nr:hypothetical protein PSECIP111951_02556 [Pseudoalteromonas sp. CIP111951]
MTFLLINTPNYKTSMLEQLDDKQIKKYATDTSLSISVSPYAFPNVIVIRIS